MLQKHDAAACARRALTKTLSVPRGDQAFLCLQERKPGTAGSEEQAAGVEGVAAPSSAAAAGKAGAWSLSRLLGLCYITDLPLRLIPIGGYLCSPSDSFTC